MGYPLYFHDNLGRSTANIIRRMAKHYSEAVAAQLDVSVEEVEIGLSLAFPADEDVLRVP
jgi:hypothetical protein